MCEKIETLQEMVNQICYAFYRYEIKNGLSLLEPMITQLTKILSNEHISEELLQEMNQLLEVILLSVEKKDFLIAADLLKYELLGRIIHGVGFSA